jgi:two-component system CheB/CheR fusion protein
LEAYTEFFKALPANTGMAFVLVQHLDPNHRSLLADIISKTAKMPVEEVTSGQKLKPNCAYVIPHNTLMAIGEGSFTLTPRGKEPRQHLSINFFMRSLAQERQSGAIGIVLSGTGADGTLGLEDIKAEGGITFAQAPESAKYDGMPRSAIDSGCVDFVLPPKDIAKELQWITCHPYVRQELEAAEIEPLISGTTNFTGVIDQLRRTSGADFSQYKPNTIQRRAMRRMLILKLNSASEYAKYLKEHHEEVFLATRRPASMFRYSEPT